ncbi:MAG: hypothetical protein HC911_01680 [Chloroflexaceae bacterium]|nr:hypothetical protein [Chloroflexaceae bacterium]
MANTLKIITADGDAEEILPAFRRQWYASGRIVCYELRDISQAIVNQWSQLAIETIQAWSADKPYLALHDLSYPGVAMKSGWVHARVATPAITDFGQQSLFPTPEAEAAFQYRIAVLVSAQQSGHFAEMIVSKQIGSSPAVLYHRTFLSRTAALNWLLVAGTQPLH